MTHLLALQLSWPFDGPNRPELLALLPEYILTLTGVLVMLAEPLLAPGRSRKPLGWLAIAGTLLATYATWYQLRYDHIHAFRGTVSIDAFALFFELVILGVVLVTLLGSLDYFEGNATHAGEYFALTLFGATGMLLMVGSVELLLIFVGLEISSIATYIMAGFRKGQATASESSIKYFLLGSFATAFFLYGIALVFGATGSTNILAMAHGLSITHTPIMAMLALGMIVIGLGFKVSAAPFHVWTPDVYQGAPAPVVGMMSTAPKAAAFAVLLRILFGGFPATEHRWAALIWIIAVLSMCIGNLGALLQRDVKRMLAYSSIAHAGYLLVAFTAFPQDGIAAACFYTATYAAMNVGAFAAITQMSGFAEGARSIEDFTGMASKRPLLTAVFAFFLLSLIGIPFTGGFFGKFYVFAAALHAGKVWLAVIGLLNSGIACVYYLRLLAAMYGRPAAQQQTVAGEAAPVRAVPIPAAIGLGLAALATLLLGIFPGDALRLAQAAAAVRPPDLCVMQPDSCKLELHTIPDAR